MTSSDGKLLESWKWKVAINGSLLVPTAISFFLLVKLFIFHIYIRVKGISTYDYILQNRNGNNKVGPKTAKDNNLLKKIKQNHAIEIRGAIDDSREAVNISGTVPMDSNISKEHTRDQDRLPPREHSFDPLRELNRTKSIDGQNRAARKPVEIEEPTEIKPKPLIIPKLGLENVGESTHKASSKDEETAMGKKLQAKNTLKEDEGSFVLSKPINPKSSDELASELDSLKPRLDLPLSSQRNLEQKEEPGEWTLREREERDKKNNMQ